MRPTGVQGLDPNAGGNSIDVEVLDVALVALEFGGITGGTLSFHRGRCRSSRTPVYRACARAAPGCPVGPVMAQVPG